MKKYRFSELDGWRGISILMVLSAHLLPLGPSSWQLNATAGPLGMALFFTLSGFLITHALYINQSVKAFMIRRAFRILPLAWLYMAVSLVFIPTNLDAIWGLFFFYANWPPMDFTSVTSHIWSLCVEMQFYLAIALLVVCLGKKGLLLLPVLALAITLNRINAEVTIAVNTYYRVDEILVGGILALIYHHGNSWVTVFFRRLNPIYFLAAFIVSCHPESGALGYLRPYLAMIVVGITLYNPDSIIVNILKLRVLGYLAVISYALYVIHPILNHSWLGDGDTMEKYIKRPLLFFILFILAHASTFYYEKYWIGLAKKLTERL